MGLSVSKRVELGLEDSIQFRSIVESVFRQCITSSQPQPQPQPQQQPQPNGSVPSGPPAVGLAIYQLSNAATLVFDGIRSHEDNFLSRLKAKWLPLPPTQYHVDYLIKKEGNLRNGARSLSLEDFRSFMVHLFRDMAMETANQRLAAYVPLGGLATVSADFALRKLPRVGPRYRAARLVLPGMVLGSIVGAAVAWKFSFP